MFLHEEYIHRHRLEVPVIHYDLHNKILLRRENPSNWRIMTLDWEFEYGHPGYWHCTFIEPIHASYHKSRNWRQLFRPRRVYWDQYDEFFKRLAADHNEWQVATQPMERELFCWEVLVYTCDNWFAQSEMMRNRRFIRLLSSSLNNKLSLEGRWENFQEAVCMIDKSNSISEFYKYNICNYTNGDSKWFARLIEHESKKLLAITD